MFNIFKTRDEAGKLKKKYARLLKEAYKMSHSDRKRSDSLYAEADRLAREIEEIERTKSAKN